MKAVSKISPILPAQNRCRPDVKSAVQSKQKKTGTESFEQVLLREEMRTPV